MRDSGVSTGRSESERLEGDSSPAGRISSEDHSSLDDVPDVSTIGDHVSLEDLRGELPGGWTLRFTLVQFGSDSLEEALVFDRSQDEPTLFLKPATLSEPTTAIEWYVDEHPTVGRKHVRTVDTLREALRAAVNWTHQRHTRR